MYTVTQRVDYVGIVLEACYGRRSGKCQATQGVDILGDLLHFCDHEGHDFNQMLRRARMHHSAELDEEIAAAGGRN